MNEPDPFSFDRHSKEMPKAVWVRVGAMLAKPLLVVAPLDKVDSLLSPIRAGVEASDCIEINPEVIPATLRE